MPLKILIVFRNFKLNISFCYFSVFRWKFYKWICWLLSPCYSKFNPSTVWQNSFWKLIFSIFFGIVVSLIKILISSLFIFRLDRDELALKQLIVLHLKLWVFLLFFQTNLTQNPRNYRLRYQQKQIKLIDYNEPVVFLSIFHYFVRKLLTI